MKRWVFLFFLVGCLPDADKPMDPPVLYESQGGNRVYVYTIHDDKRRVTCWLYVNSISCLRDLPLRDMQ